MYEGYRTPQQLNIPDFERLSVTLKGSKPAITREILIPENATFEDLHLTLQVAFGWKDAHLHQFDAGFLIGSGPMSGGSVSEPHSLDERLTWLYDLPEGQALSYEYDMGDSWEHDIKRLGKVHAEGRDPRPYIIGGSQAGPAEDSQGIRGWNELAGRLRKGKTTEEDADWLDETGYGSDYNPDAFDPAEADAKLATIPFDITGTWKEQYHRRASVRVVAPFLTDRSAAIHELSVPTAPSPGR